MPPQEKQERPEKKISVAKTVNKEQELEQLTEEKPDLSLKLKEHIPKSRNEMFKNYKNETHMKKRYYSHPGLFISSVYFHTT